MNAPEIGDLLHSAPGALGSLVSMLWLKENLWLRRAILFVGGWAFSAGAQPQVARWTHLEAGFVLGFLLGVGSMAFFAKVIESWQKVRLDSIARDFLRKALGLQPAPPTGPTPLAAEKE